MDYKELLIRTRSYRRFHQDQSVPASLLKEVVGYVRFACSAANFQPLKFIIVTDPDKCRQLFPNLKWAAYLKDWDGPTEGERPAAYIIMLGDRNLSRFVDWDYGIWLQTILLGISSKGFGACTIISFNKDVVRELLNIPTELELALVIAVGKPKEKVVIDDVKDGNIKYWRDAEQTHHVPKRQIEEFIYKIL